jgi:hypothetical protein
MTDVNTIASRYIDLWNELRRPLPARCDPLWIRS